MGVEDGAAGGFIFLWRQQLLEFRVFFGPLLIVRVKRLGHAAPADIAGEGFLFLGRGKAALRLDLPQGADGRHIILVFGFLAAYAQVIVCDTEVAPLRAGAKLLEHHVKRAGVDGACGSDRVARQLAAVHGYRLLHPGWVLLQIDQLIKGHVPQLVVD